MRSGHRVAAQLAVTLRDPTTMCAPREDALDRNAGAGGPGWRRVLERECLPSPQLHRYASDPREADCVRLLPRIRRGRALFLGNALGILPCLLAELFESVVVVDWQADRLAFAEQRRDADAIKNLACVLSSGVNDVPRQLGQFDLVVLGDEQPDAAWSLPVANVAMLRRVATAIVSDGCLMYGVRFPLGSAPVTAVRRLWKPSMPLFHRRHAGALATAGFQVVRAYGRRPATRPYQVYVPLDDPAVVAYWIRRWPRAAGLRARLRRTIEEVLIALDGLDYLFNSYLLVARRGR